MPDCEYCGHYREDCAPEELTADIIDRAKRLHSDPNHPREKTSYHRILDHRKGNTTLTWAECYGVAITEVFHEATPVLHPLVRTILDSAGMECSKLLNKENLHWMFEDRSMLEQDETVLRTQNG